MEATHFWAPKPPKNFQNLELLVIKNLGKRKMKIKGKTLQNDVSIIIRMIIILIRQYKISIIFIGIAMFQCRLIFNNSPLNID